MRQSLILMFAVAASLSAPVFAQQTDKVLTIFGNDKCPTNSNGEEIVVCNRVPETERYRIPKELRTPTAIAPENQSWSNRAASIDQIGRMGAGSCSSVGPGGWTGCWAQQMRAAKAERKQGLSADPQQ